MSYFSVRYCLVDRYCNLYRVSVDTRKRKWEEAKQTRLTARLVTRETPHCDKTVVQQETGLFSATSPCWLPVAVWHKWTAVKMLYQLNENVLVSNHIRIEMLHVCVSWTHWGTVLSGSSWHQKQPTPAAMDQCQTHTHTHTIHSPYGSFPPSIFCVFLNVMKIWRKPQQQI